MEEGAAEMLPRMACPIDESAGWTLQQLPHGRLLEQGTGLVSGVRALWRSTLRDDVDQEGRSSLRRTALQVGLELGARGRVEVAVQPEDNSVLLRLRSWLEGPKGVVVLDNLARAHARLILASDRWSQAAPSPEAESLAPLTLASVLDEPEALIRALKPGH